MNNQKQNDIKRLLSIALLKKQFKRNHTTII